MMKLRLTNDILDKLVKIFYIQIMLNNLINFVNLINTNFEEYKCFYYEQTIWYNLIMITTHNQLALFLFKTIRSYNSILLKNLLHFFQ